MGTIDFLYGPGCSVDLVCRLPTMCINTDVPRLTNGSLQKAEEGGGGKAGACLCPGVISEDVICPGLESMRNCVSQLGITSVCLYNMYLRKVREAD